ncbi:MAG TPA: ABC transporter ATP-binding protein [Solirubrobacteraceae bacterium]|nr:ABC transporter ATP-binding protein [Solirubrobacteraceae bacterium]
MNTFVRLLGFLRPYRRAVTAAALLACVAMVMTVLVPALTGAAVNALQHGAEASKAHDYSERDHYQHQLELFALAIAVAVLIRWGLTYMRRLIAGRVSLAIEYDLRERLYARLQALELAFFDRQQTGQLMSRVTVDLQAVRFFLGYGLVFILQSAITIVLAAIAMLIINPKLGAISIIPVPFVVVISQRYGRRARPAIQEVQQRIAELTANAEENIAGVRVVKSFAREPLQLQRFRASVTRVFEQSMIATRLEALFNPIIGFLPQLGLAAVLLVGGNEVIDAKLSLGAFTSFYFYLNMLINPMRTLGVTLGLAQRATASGARVFQLLDREPRLTSPPEAPALPPGKGEVVFDHVSLTYDAGDEPELVEGAAPAAGTGRHVLSDIDLTIAAGSTVALVGATGAGKTSLVSLIPRLYDVSEGAVLIDGADVRSVDLRSLRSQIAIVSDDPFLFSATIAENIAYARPEASEQEVIDAARRAEAHEFIERLPDGYRTQVGERGLTLSGGQRQRLAIARALVADPRILVLDDATSSVDSSTERKIKLALDAAMEGRTTLIIAHRLSTIALADEIIVLERGEVLARGSHGALLERSELYREIVAKGLPDQVFLTRETRPAEVSGL